MVSTLKDRQAELREAFKTKHIANGKRKQPIRQSFGASKGRKCVDMTGQRFGRLAVLERDLTWHMDYHAHWWCQCDCGREVTVAGYNLRRGGVRSCGCLRKENGSATTTHGMSKHPEYRAWAQAKNRCFNPKANGYNDYGGRGITFFQPWIDDFMAFLAHVGPKPKGRYVLDRIDNDAGYEPGNLRWATYSQSNSNKRSVKGYCNAAI